MTDVYAQNLINQVARVANNPMAIQRIVLQVVEDASDGTMDVVNPGIPFVFGIETTGCVAAGIWTNAQALSRQQYPSLSQSQMDLYRWMSDSDYVGRFATPAPANFVLFLGEEELQAKAVATGNNGVKQLIIPKNTTISVNGYDFTLQYPINILVMPSGGYQITYDSSLPSPIQTLTTNIVPYTVQPIEGISFLMLSINNVLQMSATSQQGQVSLATGFAKSYAYTDNFFFVRVFQSVGTGSSASWEEIDVTYSAQVFDETVPTVLAIVDTDNSTVGITVPQIYLTNQTIAGELRIDIYTTQGPIVVNLENIPATNFSATWQDFDGDNTQYWAPLANFATKGINSTSNVADGQGPMPLATLRTNVINNTMGPKNLPITNIDAGAYAEDLGFGLVTDVDVITNRQFLVTRSIDPPTDDSTVTGAGVTINTFQTTLDALVNLDSVADNGARMTLLPSTLYQSANGVISIVMPATIAALQALDVDTMVESINQGGFLYSPFHCVLDTTGNTFQARPYYLDNPAVTLKTYIAENPSTDLTVATNTYQLVRNAQGYQLQIAVTSSSNFQQLPDDQVFAQLCFIPVGETEYAYLNGTLQPNLVNGNRVWTFNINTNYDVDSDDNLVITNFSMFNDGPRNHSATLNPNQTFQLIYGVLNYSVQGQTTSVIDTIVGSQLLTGTPTGVTQEEYQLELGVPLDGLWHATRATATQQVYATHTANVPLLYQEDVYLTDPTTGAAIFTMVDGQPQFTILYAKGSPVLDNYGNPTYQNQIGDPILDNEGDPVAILPRAMAYEVDLLMIDGVYWWATNQAPLTYKTTVAQSIVDWIQNDVTSLQSLALENTIVYFYPQSTVGDIQVTTQDGKTTTIDAEQTFNVTYYCSQTAFNNTSFTQALEESTKTIIAGQLNSNVVSIENIQAALRQNVSTADVTTLYVSGLGGSLNLAAVKLADASQTLTVGKQLVSLPDGTLTVQDAINIAFVPFE
jgi:hypothetical protein